MKKSRKSCLLEFRILEKIQLSIFIVFCCIVPFIAGVICGKEFIFICYFLGMLIIAIIGLGMIPPGAD